MSKLITPAFLTKEVAKKAVHGAMQVVRDLAPTLPYNVKCHIVIIAPSKMAAEGELDYPEPPIKPYVLYEESFGDEWPHDFKEIARCKAQQLWDGRNDGRTDCMPHLLFPGDTPWYGGVKKEGIVVTCSGFESYFDVMVSGVTAAILIGLSYHSWAEAEGNLKGDFLPSGE